MQLTRQMKMSKAFLARPPHQAGAMSPRQPRFFQMQVALQILTFSRAKSGTIDSPFFWASVQSAWLLLFFLTNLFDPQQLVCAQEL